MNLKKFLLPFAAGALALGLAACNDDEDKANDAPEDEAAQQQEPTEEEQAQAEEMQAKLDEQQVEEGEVVATVNEEEITGEDYNGALGQVQFQMQQMGQDPTSEEAAEQVKTQTLDTLVNQAILVQKANEGNHTASEEEINEEYTAFQEQYGGEEAFNELLEEQGLEEEVIKESIADTIIIEKYIDEAVPVDEITDEEIQEYYDQASASSEETGQEVPPLEEVREDIKSSLEQQQQQEKLMQHLEELKADSEIEYLI
ncbi:SurA N-terminal domain-containing protein [Jeotgalibacillus proteolyticus]|uniref:peptidylprolyl isomerase n=1 Tax=Jeotgalibacillus proteolyticus TaxID=2082395 RepID=A0A2S5GB30_9BACL|nr:SurA N-terminal domain-containing protein [Jeotgalibacillus proteolyticus]PPA70200.1 hypothetical protein C4B60_11490 [Jeotgalibacillus proteolyticus]